jgi:hypothetical protein
MFKPDLLALPAGAGDVCTDNGQPSDAPAAAAAAAVAVVARQGRSAVGLGVFLEGGSVFFPHTHASFGVWNLCSVQFTVYVG